MSNLAFQDEAGISMTSRRSIAAILTCYNRKEKTLKCLESLHSSADGIDVYIVDDGSSDGTSEAIKLGFPQVYLIRGTGNLFWNRGMHLAWEHASRRDYDYYLWLNDDVVLRPEFLTELLECSALANENSVISGLIQAHDSDETLYGGASDAKELLPPNGVMQNIAHLNGNVVLIPRAVFAVLGNLDPKYHHDLGDVDYGWRAIQAGIPVLTTRSPVGSCDRNSFCRVRLDKSTLPRRLKRLYSTLGSNPFLSFYHKRKHFGLARASGYFLYLHIINFLPDLIVHRIFGDRYRN